MKKLLFSVFAAAAVLTSCEKSALEVDGGGTAGDVATISVNAATEATTRSLADASSATPTYYLEVYKDGNLYIREESNQTGNFSVRLVTNQDFTLVAWADYDTADRDYFNTDDLTAVTYTADGLAAINSTELDGFAGIEPVKLTNNESIEMILTRPLARINVATNDIADIEFDYLKPTHVVLSYKSDLFTTYNVLGKSIDDEETATGVVTTATAVINADGSISADYLMLPNEGCLVDFTATFYNSDDDNVTENEVITYYDFSSIPIKVNYQTNISGNLLTKTGDITVTFEEGWNTPDDDIYVTGTTTVADVDEAQEFLNDFGGGEEINLTILNVDGSEELEIPSTVAGDVNITIAAVDNSPELTVKAEDYTGGVLTITNGSEDSMDLVVNADMSHVVLDGTFGKVSGSSSDTTIEVAETGYVGELTVNKGNVSIYGEVASTLRGTDNEATVEITAYGTLGTFGEGVELVDGTILYNVTTQTQYETLTELVSKLNTTDGDVLFLGAGVHTTESGQLQPNSKVSIYGPNKGVAGTSTERKAEAQLAASVYCPTTISIDVEIDGVEFINTAGFFIEGGSNLVVKNSIISSTSCNAGDESDRMLFSNGTKVSAIITLENNLFSAADGSVLKVRTLGQRFDKESNNYVVAPLTLTMTGNTFVNYEFLMGACNYYDDVDMSSFVITGNTFTKADGTILTLFEDYSGIVYNESQVTVSGNTFNDAEVGIDVGATAPEGYDPFGESTMTLESANTFNNVDTPVAIDINFYNITTGTVYADYSTLMAAVTAGQEVYVGAGEYEIGNFGKSIKFYGANKGIAGYSEDRKAETRIVGGCSYAAPTAPTIDVTYDGIEFADGFTGFNHQQGGTVTIRNCYVSTSTATTGGTSNRVFYCQPSNSSSIPGIFTLENNLFEPSTKTKYNQFFIYGEASSTYVNGVKFTADNNKFVRTNFNFGSNNGTLNDDPSHFTITNNSFGDDTTFSLLLYNSMSTYYTVTGNTISNVNYALYYKFNDEDSVIETFLSSFEANNTFTGITIANTAVSPW